MDHRRPDLVADGVHPAMVRGAEVVVPVAGVAQVGQLRRQPDVGQRLLDRLAVAILTLRVVARTDGGVERGELFLAVLTLDRERDPDRCPGVVQPGAVVVGDVLVLVEHRQAHHVEDRLHRTDLLDLEHPARRHPGPRTGRVEPEVDDGRLDRDGLRRSVVASVARAATLSALRAVASSFVFSSFATPSAWSRPCASTRPCASPQPCRSSACCPCDPSWGPCPLP